LVEAEPAGDDGVPGYQLAAWAMRWHVGEGTQPFHDPIRVPNRPAEGGRTNPFFVNFDQKVAGQLRGLEAREHTAQVPYEERERREKDFGAGTLPVLYCSPTMELGVDIRQLNVVNMRNVPPTPANYAQRSGRAGRSGQPAFVLTYCVTGYSHDRYFFRPPERMVSGAVAPPRLDLANDVQNFVGTAVKAFRGTVGSKDGRFQIDVSESPRAVREAVGQQEKFSARFDPTVGHDEIYLSRTHPMVEGLATHVMDTALDTSVEPDGRAPAARCGVIRTKAVATRTTLLLLRFRYHILTTVAGETKPLLAEDCQIVGFCGAPSAAKWLTVQEAESLLAAEPDENVVGDVARNFLQRVIDEFDAIRARLDEIAEARGKEILDAHQRVREAVRRKGLRQTIKPQLPPDVLGLYVFLPMIA
jgi:hypothetical protein